MQVQQAKEWINRAHKRWQTFRFLQIVLLCLAVAILASALLNRLVLLPFWWAPLIAATALCVWAIFRPFWKLSENAFARYLDYRIPQLEESAALLLQPPETLNALQRLQANKIAAQLQHTGKPVDGLEKIRPPVLLLLFCTIAAGIIYLFPTRSTLAPSAEIKPPATTETIQKLPSQLTSVSVRISPPAYTNKPAREQKLFPLKAEDGAWVKWAIGSNKQVKKLSIVFNGKDTLNCTRILNSNGWTARYHIKQAGFYQVVVNGKASELYRIERIADQPAEITIAKPAQNSTIDVGRPKTVTINAFLSDDYGIRDGWISATTASGKGESVSFAEKKIRFDSGFSQKRSVKQDKTIDLQKLGMKPGDELYFYIKALDTRGQESRSDVYFVSIQDTAELMSMAGLAGGVNLVPEYFRSQRQIIIDTEKLIREKATLPETDFKNRSNAIGVDQKLLRLRYGKFLGEESEEEIGGDHTNEEGAEEHDHAGEHPGEEHEETENQQFGDAQSIIDQYAHMHDRAEDATFFEPQVKAQLKATLAEMWKAELRLRTYQPQDALPFEYKALRLLKDLQQKSRAYVAKTAVKATPLKLEKRLSGELKAIGNPVTASASAKNTLRTARLKKALAILANLEPGRKLSPSEKITLGYAIPYLSTAAAASPVGYIDALQAMQNLAGAKTGVRYTDLQRSQKALVKLMQDKQPLPQAQRSMAAPSLSGYYFDNLYRSNLQK